MKQFAELLDALIFTPGRNRKIRLLKTYFEKTPSPDRGWGLAAVTGNLDFPNVKASLIRKSIEPRVDQSLFEYSYHYVGDLAETASLMWPRSEGAADLDDISLNEVVERLLGVSSKDSRKELETLLDGFDSRERYALLKLITGGLRVGVSARLAKSALAEFGNVRVEEIEEVWHGLEAPYTSLFDWLEGKAGKPSLENVPYFRPLMLATPLDEDNLDKLSPEDFIAEWKWDGIRAQIVGRGSPDNSRLYSRAGEDISSAFPDIVSHIDFEAVLDGELLVMREGEVQSFNDLQQRLNRKTVTKKMLEQSPAFIRLYDILEWEGIDLRGMATTKRREKLEEFYEQVNKADTRFDLSPQIKFLKWDELNEKRETVQEVKGHTHVEGVMIKHKNSPYLPGRPKGHWFKWKRTPMTLDCVLMYAQRGHGKRSSYYSDYTFGCWRENDKGEPEIVPVGKAYFGFTDEELKQLDKWVRDHTTARFGPVREVEKKLVLEIAFDSAHESSRHKSGVALRFPRISRIRWDKPAEEAEGIDSFKDLLRV